MRLRYIALWVLIQTPATTTIVGLVVGGSIVLYLLLGLGTGLATSISTYIVGTRYLDTTRFRW